jgi:hypothetical protein
MMAQNSEPATVRLDMDVHDDDESYRLEINQDELRRSGQVNVLVTVRKRDQSERKASLVMVPGTA